MNKQRYNRIIDDAYKNFKNNFPMKKSNPPKDYINSKGQLLTKEEFIDKCKTDDEFSEKWGLTIEIEELGLDERKQIMIDKEIDYITVNMFFNKTLDRPKQEMYEKTIPTKLITVTYNNETFEIYE